ncbi:MAG TPA: alpha/beta fold hydrolase [Longimicrobiaceae bacterium]
METRSAGLRIHFEVLGDGPPVLLLHGYPLSSHLWDDVVGHLSDAYRLIVPDLRGHGRSEAGDTASMEEMADDVLEVLAAADEDRPVVLVGMSMGGYVSLAFARKYPQRVRALVLVDSRTAADSDEAAVARHRTAERVLREGTGFVADEMVGKLFAPGAPEELKQRWRERMAATSPRGVMAALRGMAARPDSGALLRQLGVPVLVIVGEEDGITPVEESRAIAQASGGRLEIIPGAGHMAAAEKPDAVAAALRSFLDELGSQL